MAGLLSRPAFALAAAVLAIAPAAARDYGQRGAAFPVIEPDMLALLEAKLRAAEGDGRLAAMQDQLRRRTIAHVRRPAPVEGIATTTRPRSWSYDPTITAGEDIRDSQGRVIVAAGTRLNPLDTVGLRQSLVFLNGDDPAQVRWAIGATTPVNAKLILVRGSAFELMGRHQRRFFHDQRGALTAKLGIRQVPAVVEQAGRVLRITELVPPRPSQVALNAGGRG